MSFCFLYNVVSENHSVQNSPWGGGGSIASSRSIKSLYTDPIDWDSPELLRIQSIVVLLCEHVFDREDVNNTYKSNGYIEVYL